ncbi:MAG: glycosyltransferase [Pseudomonadota bacterium]
MRDVIHAVDRIARPIARKALPASIAARLAAVARAFEFALAKQEEKAFAARDVPLAAFPRLLRSEEFADGPVILCNNALASGGVERQIVNTLKGLAPRLRQAPGLLCVQLNASRDHDFYLSALKDYPGQIRNVIDFADAQTYLADAGAAAVDGIQHTIGWMPSYARAEIMRFMADFIRLKPSVVHAWQDSLSISAGYAARLAGVPRIIISSRNMAASHFAYHRPYMANAYRELASCKEIVMLNNSEAGAHDYAGWLGIPVERYRIVRNGIDAETIARPAPEASQALRQKLRLPPGVPVVGSIFRFYPEKRPNLWIEAAARVAAKRPDCHFVIFGNGPMRKRVLSSAKKYGFADRLRCPGTIEDAALGLSIMDAFLLTSALEGTPNVVLEAELMEVPVVATEAGGTREAIDDGITGFVVPPSGDKLAEKLLKILSDEPWRVRTGSAGRQFVLTRFSLDRMLDETLAIYHN